MGISFQIIFFLIISSAQLSAKENSRFRGLKILKLLDQFEKSSDKLEKKCKFFKGTPELRDVTDWINRRRRSTLPGCKHFFPFERIVFERAQFETYLSESLAFSKSTKYPHKDDLIKVYCPTLLGTNNRTRRDLVTLLNRYRPLTFVQSIRAECTKNTECKRAYDKISKEAGVSWRPVNEDSYSELKIKGKKIIKYSKRARATLPIDWDDSSFPKNTKMVLEGTIKRAYDRIVYDVPVKITYVPKKVQWDGPSGTHRFIWEVRKRSDVWKKVFEGSPLLGEYNKACKALTKKVPKKKKMDF